MVFEKRRRTLPPDQFNTRRVRTKRGITMVGLFSAAITRAEREADALLRRCSVTAADDTDGADAKRRVSLRVVGNGGYHRGGPAPLVYAVDCRLDLAFSVDNPVSLHRRNRHGRTPRVLPRSIEGRFTSKETVSVGGRASLLA
jgi:hypothetical protein